MLVYFALGDVNFSRFYPMRNLKVAFYPTRNPNASQWNIGCVGCQRNIFALSMYISCYCVDFICVGHPTQTRFFVEYGLYTLSTLGTHLLAPGGTTTPCSSSSSSSTVEASGRGGAHCLLLLYLSDEQQLDGRALPTLEEG